MRRFSVLLLAAAVSGCVGAPAAVPSRTPPAPTSAPATGATTQAPPPMAPTGPQIAPTTGEFIAPRVLDIFGLRGVIGANAASLSQTFGPPRLTVREDDSVKLQFGGDACVLDIFLYPLRPNGEPSATHVEARRASDGRNVDRAACVAALKR